MLEDREDQGFQGGDWTHSVVTGVKNVEAEAASLRGGVGLCWMLGALGCGKCKAEGQ